MEFYDILDYFSKFIHCLCRFVHILTKFRSYYPLTEIATLGFDWFMHWMIYEVDFVATVIVIGSFIIYTSSLVLCLTGSTRGWLGSQVPRGPYIGQLHCALYNPGGLSQEVWHHVPVRHKNNPRKMLKLRSTTKN